MKYVVPRVTTACPSRWAARPCVFRGKECCDEKKSALESCSQLKVSADPVDGKCRFCLKSRDTLGAVVFNTVPAMVKHHATAWKFETAWTIGAWIKKTGPGDAAGEYILGKWNDGPTGGADPSSAYVYLRLQVGDAPRENTPSAAPSPSRRDAIGDVVRVALS